VVLNDPRHHADHPGFSKLFVQTEALADQGLLLAHRRPRSPEQRHPWLAHAVRGEGALSFETDRARFLGRGRGADAPIALLTARPLSGSTGAVLDPVLVLRRVVEIAPGATSQIEMVSCAAESRDHVLELARGLSVAGAIDTSRQLAEELATQRLATHGLSPQEGERLERVAAALLYADPRFRPGRAPANEHFLRASSHLNSPFPPRGAIVVESDAPASTVNEMLTAHAYWRELGLATTLVVLTLEATARESLARLSAIPGVSVFGPDAFDALGLARLRAEADWIVRDGTSPQAMSAPTRDGGTPAPSAIPSGTAWAGEPEGDAGETTPWPLGDEPLRCFNGTGGFSARGDEYVIRLPRTRDGCPRLTPRPWINVLANPGFGALISESGAGCTWSRNSREFRLTPWSNDPVRDPHDEAFYLRDEESGLLWSPFPGPIPGDGPYEMRHGFGSSRCRHSSGDLEVETEVFVHASDPVKVVHVKLSNPGARARRLSVVAYQRLVLGELPERAARVVSTSVDERERILFARPDRNGPFADAVAFAAPVLGAGSSTIRMGCDREQFLGAGGSPARPAALLAGRGSEGRTGFGIEPCFCIQVVLELGPGESRSCAFLLGEAPDVEAIESMVRGLRRPGALSLALDEVRAAWAERLGRVQVETPVEPLDLLVNGWLAYQTLACRLWGRTAFYQSGGAYGFRDQLQDAAAFLTLEPKITRDQILLHCAHQFVEGDVLHWWHPPPGQGIRTRFADDLLWLPFVTASYVQVTGEVRVLSEPVSFIEGRLLGPKEDEALMFPTNSAEIGDVYEHCCRAIERSLATGAHGLPLFGSGDWNDGMNRVGREGRGESVWMAFFLYAVIDAFIPCCETRADTARIDRWRDHQRQLTGSLERAGWDGGWYRRGYYDDGSTLGSQGDDECRIDALAQAWSVLSGAVPRERCERAMDALEHHLIDWDAGLVRLLTPPFDRTPHDPGYIKGYLPGVRENGGQYTHAALWVVSAMAGLGRRDRAARLFEILSPVSHARTAAEVEAYQVEPYVVAADVCGNPQHLGEGGWTWYTASAGWMLRVALESVLGVTLEGGDTLVVRAAIPASWPGFRVRLRPWGRRGTCDVSVRNTSAEAPRVIGATLDGVTVTPAQAVARIPLADDGLDHRVEIVLG
jgi:cellobiose phosphorylase